MKILLKLLILFTVGLLSACSVKGVIDDQDLALKYRQELEKSIAAKPVKTKVVKDKKQEEYKKGGYKYSVELKGVQVIDFVDAVFGKVLEVPYIIDQSVKSQNRSLDISIKKRISKTDLHRMVVKSLEKIGYWVETENGVVYVYGKEDKDSKPNLTTYHVTLSNVTTEDIIEAVKAHADASEKVNVSGDGRRNLVISGEYYAARRMSEIASMLDQSQKRIRVDVEIYEMTMTGALKMGFEGFVNRNFGELLANITMPASGLQSVYSATVSHSNLFSGIISMLKKDDLLKSVAKPFLYCTDAKECTFNVGSKIPVLQAQKVSTEGTSTVNNLQYYDTGVNVSITPTVISGNDLMMEVVLESSKGAQNTISSLDSPVIINRKLKSEIRAKNGLPLVIAGIIYNQKESVYSKLPLEIKALSWLKNTYIDEMKTELIIILTP